MREYLRASVITKDKTNHHVLLGSRYSGIDMDFSSTSCLTIGDTPIEGVHGIAAHDAASEFVYLVVFGKIIMHEIVVVSIFYCI